MRLLRVWGQQVLLSFVVLSAVFASGYMAGASSGLAAMQMECQLAKGQWAEGICMVMEKPK